MLRKNDFRAFGSGNVLYDIHHFNKDDIHLAINIHKKLKSQCAAMDLV